MKTITHYLLNWNLTNDSGTVTLNMKDNNTNLHSQKNITNLDLSKFNMFVAVLENGMTTFDQANNSILNIVQK